MDAVLPMDIGDQMSTRIIGSILIIASALAIPFLIVLILFLAGVKLQ